MFLCIIMCMEFINREQEMRRLDHVARLPEGGLVVIWGRRRMGKTRLLLEWAKKYNGVYYTADESSETMQRKYFAAALEQVLLGFASVTYPDWLTLLQRLAREARQAAWHGPLIIDELPYLAEACPELPSILQKFIDREAKEAKLIIALSGSSQQMMQSTILAADAPLYGRATEMLKLGPISVGYIGKALHLTNPREIIETYSIWGGVPRYWELVANKKDTLIDSIDRLVLDPIGALHDEPNRFLLEEMPPAISLRPILDAIGLGSHRLSDIATRVGHQMTSLGRPLHRLIELDLVKREVPFGVQEQNTKRTLYKIQDPFFRFWFEMVAPRRSYFAQTIPAHRKHWVAEHLHPLVSATWEELCRQVIPLLFQGLFTIASRYWHGQGNEFDIVAASLDASTLLIGEAKWTEKRPTEVWIDKILKELQSKQLEGPLKGYASYMYVLFVPEKPPQLDLPDYMKVIDAAEVIQAFANSHLEALA